MAKKLADAPRLAAVTEATKVPEVPQKMTPDQAGSLLVEAFLTLTVLLENYEGQELAAPAARGREAISTMAATLLLRDKLGAAKQP